jgi:hypothetical protein
MEAHFGLKAGSDIWIFTLEIVGVLPSTANQLLKVESNHDFKYAHFSTSRKVSGQRVV